MIYNFDEEIDRSNNYAAKYEEACLWYGTNDVIPMWMADMDLKTAQPIVDAIKKRADQAIFGYTYRPEKYFKTVANWQYKRHGYLPDVNKMAFNESVIPAIRMILELFTKPEDKVLILEPGYHSFADAVRITGRTLVISELKRDENYYYTVDFNDFEEKAKQGIRYFIFCNPHNPVGRAWTKEEIQKLGDICIKYGIEIISDEIHADLMLDGHKHYVTASVSPEIEKITTTCNAPTKSFNLAGIQGSTIIFNTVEKKEAYVAEIKRLDIARNNCFSLVAIMAAYEEGEEWLEQLLLYISDNMKFIREYCAKNLPMIKPNTPEATYLCWLDCTELGLSGEELVQFMVKEAKVAFGKGYEFGQGGEAFLRMNVACRRARVKEVLDRVKEALIRTGFIK